MANRREGNGNWKGYDRWLLKNYRQIILDTNSRCTDCGSTQNLLVHHDDENRANNLITNLVVLCPSCHQYRHHSAR